MTVVATPTPNPNAYVFQVQEILIPSGTYEFSHDGDMSSSPLAQKIFQIEGIELLMVAPKFITVRKFSNYSWDDLLPVVQDSFQVFLQTGEMVVFENSASPDTQNLSDVEHRILDILEEEVRPAIAQDGGDFVYHGFENGIVKLQLIGACGTCPSSSATLHMGIERLLMEEIPEVRGIEQVEVD